jgi:hypothetical protein
MGYLPSLNTDKTQVLPVAPSPMITTLRLAITLITVDWQTGGRSLFSEKGFSQ